MRARLYVQAGACASGCTHERSRRDTSKSSCHGKSSCMHDQGETRAFRQELVVHISRTSPMRCAHVTAMWHRVPMGSAKRTRGCAHGCTCMSQIPLDFAFPLSRSLHNSLRSMRMGLNFANHVRKVAKCRCALPVLVRYQGGKLFERADYRGIKLCLFACVTARDCCFDLACHL